MAVDHRAVAERLYELMRASPMPANMDLDGPEPSPDIAEYRRRANLEPEESGKLVPYLIRAMEIKKAFMAEILAQTYGDEA